MSVTVARQRDAGPHAAGGPVLGLVASKLHRPLMRPGTVRRSLLIERLARAGHRPIVSVVAPAGYGKTTLLAQWAEANGQAFAWVSAGEGDNDAKVLLRYVAEALDAVEPIDRRVFDALASRGSLVPGSVVPRLCWSFCSMSSPVVLVLDDVHVLHNPECQAAVSLLADHVPPGSRLVLAGRAEPPLRVARLRAEGKLLEIGTGDLSLSLGEASSLLRAAGIALGPDEMAELHRRTEGWPVGLYLAALYLREGGALAGTVASFGGDDRFVSGYLESEFLARITRQQRVFLTRTAALERMCGPLCDAVLDQGGSAATLAELAHSNLLLVPLDRRGQWYRYHHLFRDMLLAELERQEPQMISLLRRRAARWCQGNGLPEGALEYSMAAGDADTAAGLVAAVVVPAYRQGRATTVPRWFGWLEQLGGIEGHPMAAVLFSALLARPAEAERWAKVIDRWQDGDLARPAGPAVAAWAAMTRAILCRHGIEVMRADADEAMHRCAAQGIRTPAPALAQGMARLLSGDLDGADLSFQDAIGVGPDASAPVVLPIALCQRSLIAMARGDWDQAEALAGQTPAALRRAGAENSFAVPLVCAVRAHLALHRGDTSAAGQELTDARRWRPLLTYALPHLAVQTRIELARVYLALADVAGARTLMREIDGLLRRRGGLGTLDGQAEALRAQLQKHRAPAVVGAPALTAAELRLLPLLTTHLTIQEIAAELYLSHNTIRTQAKSIYRKFGASGRSQAIAQARRIGLLEH